MNEIPLLIGYSIDKALIMIGEKYEVELDLTITPYRDKIEERQGNAPIVVRQKVENGKIRLMTTYFAKSTLH